MVESNNNRCLQPQVRIEASCSCTVQQPAVRLNSPGLEVLAMTSHWAGSLVWDRHVHRRCGRNKNHCNCCYFDLLGCSRLHSTRSFRLRCRTGCGEPAPVRWPAASGGACRKVRPVRQTGAQGRRWAEVEGKFEAMWSMALRALDDIKESVRLPLPCRAAV